MRRRLFSFIFLLFLVFTLIDLFLIALELFGVHTPFIQRVHEDGRVVLFGSDLLVFILSVPVALFLEVLWEKEKWSWFGEGRSPRKNVFLVFLLLFTVLAFALIVGGSYACSELCESVRSCTVTYRPLSVEILYSCRQIIQALPR
ncbi:TPA: hypothetical protein EYP13_05285 [Candidatus Micrarchaeota archaeon]|nr:hypothetical protein [Candidatus Micrarchaeota archaeon]